jgi:hypothetical protein
MPSAKDVTAISEYLKVMSVGDSGTGKSVFAATFPTPGFIFDFGGEILSYKGKDFDYEQYDVSPLGWTKFERDFIQLKKDLKEEEKKEGKYQTVIVDNLSAMTDLSMEKALQLDPKRSPTNGPLWNVHYGMVKNLMEGKLRQFLNLNCNLVLISHINTLTDENGAVIGVEPSLTGQLSADVPSYFDEVYYHSTRKEGGDIKWYLQTVPIGRNKGRSRSSGRERLLPDMITNDYAEVMAYLTGKKVKPKKQQLKRK